MPREAIDDQYHDAAGNRRESPPAWVPDPPCGSSFGSVGGICQRSPKWRGRSQGETISCKVKGGS